MNAFFLLFSLLKISKSTVLYSTWLFIFLTHNVHFVQYLSQITKIIKARDKENFTIVINFLSRAIICPSRQFGKISHVIFHKTYK